jgi:hypothetical protein
MPEEPKSTEKIKEPTAPKKEPPIDVPKQPAKDTGKDKGVAKGNEVHVHVHIHQQDDDDSIVIGEWDLIDDPRDAKKAKKRKALQRIQTHRSKKGTLWFVTEQASTNGDILGLSISGDGVPAGIVPAGTPFKRVSKTRDGLTIVDKDGKTYHYDADHHSMIGPH